MNFWIFMLVMNLLIPLVMIIFGRVFEKKPPKIGMSKFAFGYRTIMSMRNADTWEYAHRFFGKLWFRFGIVLGLISIIVLFFFIGKDKDTVGFAGMIICYVQMAVMLIPVIPTEISLRKRFDKNGNRKDDDEKN
ncbi:SdpI/YhfL family protein [Lachnoanaerobaculum sp. MSX33]|uniref:SdpI family protein n=1 Tax=Lachnoanaerobaculum sp. MSX33 TaxID=936596 RepID=UPI0003DFB07D|nr:SdpI family protein [Lachnoanaerobaculum sp. MSX33]ETO97416.1 SdpI/YhfL family protein [Lachnoanaerobaculum sp. MSX33]MDU6630326.1 SdpI family protein [Lachnoanaerobaculum sp.]